MGALHAGHRSLIDVARVRGDAVVVSIFVNPTQFSPGGDCERYPRPLQTDLEVCRNAGVDLVFTPTATEMYPPHCSTSIHVSGLTAGLCGAHRPGHFDGVTTVVAKLFNIVPAHLACFGEKDYQQLKVVQRMVRDLGIPIDIVPCSTVREPDGLAVSSRNVYLSATERRQASALSRALRRGAQSFSHGQRSPQRLIEQATDEIRQAGPFVIDYVSVVDAETLEPLDTVGGEARMCVAARLGECRLIDNLPLGAAREHG